MSKIEYFSPSGKYKLIIQSFPDYKKCSIYSISTNQWVGEIEINDSHFIYLFFQRNGNEYFLSPNAQTIINCEMGHVYNLENKLNWTQMWQVDDDTLCVLESDIYSFYDISNLNLGYRKLNVITDGILSSLKKNYILHKDNYVEPIINDGIITFVKKETRIFGIGINQNNVKEIDMEISEYEKQKDTLSGINIPYYTLKTYKLDLMKIKFKRENENMKMIQLWRDERQFQLDGEEEEKIEMSERCRNIYQDLYHKLHSKYKIRVYPVIENKVNKWNIMLYTPHTRSYCYMIIFEDKNDTSIKIQYLNFKYPEQNKDLIVWSISGVEDFIH